MNGSVNFIGEYNTLFSNVKTMQTIEILQQIQTSKNLIKSSIWLIKIDILIS